MAVVTGKLEMYKGKPQIVVTGAKHLSVLVDEEVPVAQPPGIDQ